MPRGSKPGERRGGRQKGTPNKATAEVKVLAHKYAPAAIEELGRLSTGAESEAARVAATRSRGFPSAANRGNLAGMDWHPRPKDDAWRQAHLRCLRALKREDGGSRYMFMTERGAPMTPAGFRKLLSRLAVTAKFQFPVHPHMLRHACGYKLANDGRDTRALQHYLGHKNIMHTVRYTELSPERFKDFWED